MAVASFGPFGNQANSNSCYVWYIGLNDGPAARRPLHGLYSTSQVRKDVCIVVLVDFLVSLYIYSSMQEAVKAASSMCYCDFIK